MRVKELREDAGLTQRDLADLAGLSHVTVNHIENGKTPPRPRTLRKIAEALDVRVRDLREDRSTYLIAGQRVPDGYVATLVRSS